MIILSQIFIIDYLGYKIKLIELIYRILKKVTINIYTQFTDTNVDPYSKKSHVF